MMNKDYFTFLNLTWYNEVIKKFISPQCSQYVLVALTRGRMVHSHKLLWEFLISKREWLINKELNSSKQKEQSEKERPKKLQKPAGLQLDERVESILKDTLHPEASKKTDEGKHKKKHGSISKSNKKHKQGNKQPMNQQLLPTQVPVALPTMFSQTQVAMLILCCKLHWFQFLVGFLLKNKKCSMWLFQLDNCHRSRTLNLVKEEETSIEDRVVVQLEEEGDAAGKLCEITRWEWCLKYGYCYS